MTAWTIVRQAPLSMGILQARVLNGLPHPPPGDLPNPGIEPRSSTLQVDSESEPPRNPKNTEEGSLSLLQGESWLGLETVNLPRARSGHIAPQPRLLNVHTDAVHCTGMESRAGSAQCLPTPRS